MKKEKEEQTERIIYKAKSKEMMTRLEEVSVSFMAALLGNPGVFMDKGMKEPGRLAQVAVTMAGDLLRVLDDFEQGTFDGGMR